jgi:hypothetical protein
MRLRRTTRNENEVSEELNSTFCDEVPGDRKGQCHSIKKKEETKR